MQYLQVTKYETTCWNVVVQIPDTMKKDTAISILRAEFNDNLENLISGEEGVEGRGGIDFDLFDDIDATEKYEPDFALSNDGSVKECEVSDA